MDELLKSDLLEIKRRTIGLLKSMKIQFLTASIVPVLAGTSLAFTEIRGIDWSNFLLALLGTCLLHLSANIFNDYFDHLNGTDSKNTEFVRHFTGGSRTIQDGIIKPYRTLIWAATFLLAGSITGVLLLLRTGIVILFLGLIGVISVLFYVNRGFYLAASGFGELTIFLNFGPLPVLGAYYVQTGTISLTPLILSLPIGFLITAVLYINQFPDFNADKESGKTNLVVRLGRRRARWGYLILILLTYISIGLFISTKLLPAPGIIIFLNLPLAILSSVLLLKFYEDIPKLVPALPATITLHLTTGYFITVTLLYDTRFKPYTYILMIVGLLYLAFTTYSLFKASHQSSQGGTKTEAKDA